MGGGCGFHRLGRPRTSKNLVHASEIAAGLLSTSMGLSGVSKEGFETIVHVLLKVTMEQRKTGLIGSEIDDRPAVVGDDDRVLHHARSLFAVDFDQFPEMAVQVHRVSVVGTISHDKPIARALLQHKFPVVRIGFAVYQP